MCCSFRTMILFCSCLLIGINLDHWLLPGKERNAEENVAFTYNCKRRRKCRFGHLYRYINENKNEKEDRNIKFPSFIIQLEIKRKKFSSWKKSSQKCWQESQEQLEMMRKYFESICAGMNTCEICWKDWRWMSIFKLWSAGFSVGEFHWNDWR